MERHHACGHQRYQHKERRQQAQQLQTPSARLLQAAAADTSVEAPGFVDDVRPWVARSAVYVVPLRVGGGTRLKMVDAMAQGKAIVATLAG